MADRFNLAESIQRKLYHRERADYIVDSGGGASDLSSLATVATCVGLAIIITLGGDNSSL